MVRKKKETSEQPEDPYLLTEEDLKYNKTQGLGDTRKERLDENGLKYIHDICMVSPNDISRATGLDLGPCEVIWLKCKKRLQELGVIPKDDMSAKEEYEYENNTPRLQTKCEAVDILFDGGIRMRTLTEAYGEFGSGKTQMCYTLAAEILARKENVYIIDCEGTFKYKRLIEVAKSRGYLTEEFTEEDFLSRVIKKIATNSFEARKILENMTGEMLKNNVKLVIVDGIVGQVRKEWEGRAELSERQQYLKPIMTRLGSMPKYMNCWVIFTNQVQHDPGQFFGDPTKPIGGNVVGHESTYRLYFKKLGKTTWQAVMVDSPEHAKLEVKFQLGSKGLEDIPDELRKLKRSLEKGIGVDEVPMPEFKPETETVVNKDLLLD